jgi:uncharacterized repeat protein (TIGR01451 family)
MRVQARSRTRRLAILVTVLAVAGLAVSAAYAVTPGVDPASVTNTVNPGDSFTVAKTVHTPPIPPRPDVVFLADTTGSMGPTLANVQANATAIMNAVRLAQSDADFAAAQYKDFNCGLDAFAFNLDQGVSASIPAVQTAINSWFTVPGSGCDTPEAQVNALFELATNPAVAFRSGSTPIVVWFGDASGHDPSGGHTLTDAINALVSAGITVLAIPVTTSSGDGLDSTGQATAVATATGGAVLPSAAPDQVSAAILAGLSNLPVTVTPSPTCDAGLTVAFTPAGSQTVTSGADVNYTETITVDPGNPGGATLHCTVDFLLNGLSGGPAFTEQISVTVNGADLQVVKTGPALVTEGQSVTYHLAVTNNGPANATGVAVTDTLPTNSTFVSASAGCAEAAGVVTCTVGSLASGASTAFDITVTAGSAGTSLTNTAVVGGNQFDPNTANNTSTVVTTLNHNPVCTAVNGGPKLWPPNHKLRLITLTGATDADGDPVALTVTGVTQDEPLNGLGDGDTSPDATPGTAAGNVYLRAERSGLGDGRVYRISFTGSDGRGGSCTGVARVGVPHDQGAGSTPIDSGLVFVDF